MPEIIKFEPHGIKCDMPGCGWRDDSVVFNKRTYAREWLNKPCPACGGNLYTQRDYELVRRMFRATRIVNALFGWMVWLAPKEKRGVTEHASFGSDGRGYFTEAEVEPGGQWEKILAKVAERRARKQKGELTITYTLTEGKRPLFVWHCLRMTSIPLRTRWELITSAIRSKDGKATGVIRAPQPFIDAMVARAKEIAG